MFQNSKVTNIINSLLHLSLGHLCLLPACGINILSGLPKVLLLILLPGMNIKKKTSHHGNNTPTTNAPASNLSMISPKFTLENR